jgi:hypothetical protein
LLLRSSYLPLGVPNWVVICPHQATFSGIVAGEKEDFCKGSLARTIFYFVYSFALFYFCLHLYIKNTKKKLVPSIVVIFVGLLLSCFIMLSINGWFL